MTGLSSQPEPEAATDGPLRCVSIDVEEYFHIEAAHGRIDPADRSAWPARAEQTVARVLELLDRQNRRGTFFMLGAVADAGPHLPRRIADAGHEIATHGPDHQRLRRLDAATFRRQIGDCKRRLEDQAGRPVIGYRAPTFSLVPATAWAIDVLAEAGFQYDASIFPVHHPSYGVPSAPDRPFWVQASPGGPTMLEVPALTWSLTRRKKLPVAGGGYFRLLPQWFMRRGLEQAAATGRPAILYFHPWEFDPATPRMPLSRIGRLRTSTGLQTAAVKLDRILALPARWSPIADALDELKHLANQTGNFCLRDA
jgi:polysaccharide deacetylase family protein (PEP-CTERM system associated)